MKNEENQQNFTLNVLFLTEFLIFLAKFGLVSPFKSANFAENTTFDKIVMVLLLTP